MLTFHSIHVPSYGRNFQLIDAEFDRFELNTEFEETLRDAAAANFYHDARDSDE